MNRIDQLRQAELDQGKRPVEDQAKVDEATACACRMEAWRRVNNGAWRNSQFQCGDKPQRPQTLEQFNREYRADFVTEPFDYKAEGLRLFPVGRANAKRVGWEAYFEGKGRDANPFPPARRDLGSDYLDGWDEASENDPR